MMIGHAELKHQSWMLFHSEPPHPAGSCAWCDDYRARAAKPKPPPESETTRLRRRISVLEGRLAHLLRLAQGTGMYMHWTDFNGGGTVWSHVAWNPGRRGKGRGRVWSRRPGRGRGR